MHATIISSDLSYVDLEPGSVPSEWLLGGQPGTRSKFLGKTRDQLAVVVLWECGAASFKWHYRKDEVLFVLSGEAFILDEKGGERRLGPRDVAFFSAGTDATWHIPDHLRKIAVLKTSIWSPLGLFLKAWVKLFEVVGLSGKSGF
jgi:uncharacterized cupin superfamily protein